MKKYYYTVELELDYFNETDGSLTGNKTVSVYVIKDDDMISVTDLELTNDCDSEDEIQNWLDDNGYGDDVVQFVRL
jgi:hypothetical protein